MLFMLVLMLTIPAREASAGAVLKLGDILVAEPATASISVVDPATGVKTITSRAVCCRRRTRPSVLRSRWTVTLSSLTENRADSRESRDWSQSVLSQGGHFRDPWAIAIDKDTGYIYVADSGYDNDRPDDQ